MTKGTQMHTFTPSPALIELRQEIDTLDQELATLLCKRLLLIHRAAPLKPLRENVRLEDRIEDIIQKITPIADTYGLERSYLEKVYRFLIEESIASEMREWDKLHTTSALNP